MCDTPPVEKRKMTCFARPLKCEAFGASGSDLESSASSWERKPGRSSEPPASEWMNWRRLQLSDIDKLVQAEQDAGKTLPGLGLSEARARLRQIVEGGRGFVLGGGATQGQLEAALDAVRVVLPFLLQAGGARP